jgi:CheY-like chemotaxis protein
LQLGLVLTEDCISLRGSVLECECGLDALRLLEIHQVTHVLLDISMPEMKQMGFCI